MVAEDDGADGERSEPPVLQKKPGAASTLTFAEVEVCTSPMFLVLMQVQGSTGSHIGSGDKAAELRNGAAPFKTLGIIYDPNE